MNIPPPNITISDILIELNGTTGIGDWVKMPGHYAISDPTINSDTTLNFLQPTSGILLVVFVNKRTAEIKSFIAKFTDDPIRNKLWQ
ncbi:TPA: hypothetical protein DEP30_03880 [Candidatus Nomurabacteria bacterium]|nr:MAG: hypothetical protein US00_C0004G0037 [Candidatus Nomurabacteria bacterium GW2011_GWF2_36_126]KKP96365.1 MAG: hypothetical protein US04_C0002G0037 [Candidatus Nomurabacteria bacterium GW2011_GWD2_36_14]KKP99026.1 MAG: hypothetical protein US08_C0004G0037 [Candidatus Nomurabacteria bacterium GW2011_GWF2_36_19]KKQ05192.1 MAG: hypothetical protein US17_C0006G0039 [Candidatus Nomurabacteria bacterium GW2011_GWF1_36_47]KKQ09177.1 MAG: hypothetical protein US21_C0007G0036 [Candidatus Nomurabac